MASSEQVKALLKSHLAGDDKLFLSIALQIAAHEARSGHGKLAIELRDIVEQAKYTNTKPNSVSIAKGLKDVSGLLYVTHPKYRLNDLITTDDVKNRIKRAIREQRHLGKLKNHGLYPRRRLLLIGPPGTGKTFTASVLAGELDYPLFQVRLDAVVTKYMGESSAKLRQVFDAVRDVRGVYFFDEFDALGAERSTPNDIGEARRILNSFLQMIEQDDSNSVIVCATNYAQMLDSALFRRFDDVIQYRLPVALEIVSLLRSRLTPYVESDFEWKKLAKKAEGLSSAEVTLVAHDAIKELLINEKHKITASMVEFAIDDRRSMSHETHR